MAPLCLVGYFGHVYECRQKCSFHTTHTVHVVMLHAGQLIAATNLTTPVVCFVSRRSDLIVLFIFRARTYGIAQLLNNRTAWITQGNNTHNTAFTSIHNEIATHLIALRKSYCVSPRTHQCVRLHLTYIHFN